MLGPRRPAHRPTAFKPQPGRLSKRRPMTIALGFVHRGGVVLCADTELTAGERKLHGSKIFHFDCAVGRFAFVFAGHVPNLSVRFRRSEHNY